MKTMMSLLIFWGLFLTSCGGELSSHDSNVESSSLEAGEAETDVEEESDFGDDDLGTDSEEVDTDPEEVDTDPEDMGGMPLPSVSIESITLEFVDRLNANHVVISGMCSEDGLAVYVSVLKSINTQNSVLVTTTCVSGLWEAHFDVSSLGSLGPLGGVLFIIANHNDQNGRPAPQALTRIVTNIVLGLLLPILS